MILISILILWIIWQAAYSFPYIDRLVTFLIIRIVVWPAAFDPLISGIDGSLSLAAGINSFPLLIFIASRLVLFPARCWFFLDPHTVLQCLIYLLPFGRFISCPYLEL